MGIPTFDETAKKAFVSRKIGFGKGQDFMLYGTAQVKVYVHYVASRSNPLKVKVNSERVWDIVISH